MFESGTGSLAEHIVLEGTIPFDDIVFITLEDDTGVLALEDSRPGTGRLLHENDRVAVPVGLIQNENDRILFEDDDNDVRTQEYEKEGAS